MRRKKGRESLSSGLEARKTQDLLLSDSAGVFVARYGAIDTTAVPIVVCPEESSTVTVTI
jgi:hypothetical protein